MKTKFLRVLHLHVLVCLLGGTTLAKATNVFAFQDVAGYKSCLVQGPVIEATAAQAGTQMRRMLSENEIIARCVTQAKRLASARPADVAFIKELIHTTKRNVAHEVSLGLILLWVQQDTKACNSMANFETIQKALARPADYPSAQESFVNQARKVIVHCLKDPEFRSDMIEELQSTNAYISANTCTILTAQQVVKACRRKP